MYGSNKSADDWVSGGQLYNGVIGVSAGSELMVDQCDDI